MNRFARVVTVAAVGLLAFGCASHGSRTQESQEAIESMKDTRQELVSSKTSVNNAIKALDQLSSGSNLEQSFKAYTNAVKGVDKAGSNAAESAKEMREKRREYVAKWEAEVEQISNPELKAGAMARRQAVRQHFDEITTAGAAARDAYNPFLRDLKDIQRALANDLTPAGVQAAGGAIDKAKGEGQALNERIDAVIAKLDEVTGAMAGNVPAQAK